MKVIVIELLGLITYLGEYMIVNVSLIKYVCDCLHSLKCYVARKSDVHIFIDMYAKVKQLYSYIII